jgi:hypothetical protein
LRTDHTPRSPVREPVCLLHRQAVVVRQRRAIADRLVECGQVPGEDVFAEVAFWISLQGVVVAVLRPAFESP